MTCKQFLMIEHMLDSRHNAVTKLIKDNNYVPQAIENKYWFYKKVCNTLEKTKDNATDSKGIQIVSHSI